MPLFNPPPGDTTCRCTGPNSLSVGDVVYVSGPGRAVDLVDITNRTKVAAVGIIISKSGTDYVIQTSGVLPSMYAGTLTPGALYFVDTAGRPTSSRPHGDINVGDQRWVVAIGKSIDEDTLSLEFSGITGVWS